MDKMTEFMTKDVDYPLSSRVVTGEIYHCFVKASSFFDKNVFVKKCFDQPKYYLALHFSSFLSIPYPQFC